MNISDLFDNVIKKFICDPKDSPTERFYYFFWDLVHYYSGITGIRKKFQPNVADITSALDESIRDFSFSLMKIKSGLSHPINLNNINRYGWEWIIEHAKILIGIKYDDNCCENFEKLIKDHKELLVKNIFNNSEKIGYKGILR